MRRSGCFMLALLAGILCFAFKAAADGEGEEISPQLANKVLPYAVLSFDAYNTTSNFGSFANLAYDWQRIDDWKSVLTRHNYSPAVIREADRAGFYAAVYRNSVTGEVAIAYRGTRRPNLTDIQPHGLPGLGTSRPGAADAAAQVARFVKQDFPNAPSISLTGHSLGGYWATYASRESGITNVYAFNGARGLEVSNFQNSHQINVVVSGELIGDPNTGTSIFGNGRLPGKTYGIDSSTDTHGVLEYFDGKFGAHNLNGIIWALTAQALKEPI